MWSRRTGRFSFNRIAASDFSATMPSHHLSFIWHRAIFRRFLGWISDILTRVWFHSHAVERYQLTHLILFVGFRDVGNLQSVANLQSVHTEIRKGTFDKSASFLDPSISIERLKKTTPSVQLAQKHWKIVSWT